MKRPPTTPRRAPAKGRCYIVGAGPGDPGLITVRALECLRKADVILYDFLCNPVLLQYARPEARRIYAGKKSSPAGTRPLTQKQINDLLVRETAAGNIVCRLKGGDPYVFGRGGEEAMVLRQKGLPFEVVPGVSSSVAAAAYAGIPVTYRDYASAFTVLTGHEDPAKKKSAVNWKAAAAFPGTKVVLMGVEPLEKICRELISGGLSARTPAAVIRWGTYGRQQTVTAPLSDLPRRVREAGLKPPAVVVIGQVVNLRKHLDWFEARPLFGKRMVVTRTQKQAGTLADRLQELGADVIALPTLEIVPAADPAPLRRAVRRINRYTWVVLTSVNAAEYFLEEFLRIHKDIRKLGPVRFAAVGDATARYLESRHLSVEVKPEKFTAANLARTLARRTPLKGRHILLPRSDKAHAELPQLLKQAGAHCEEVVAYRNIPARLEGEDHLLKQWQAGVDWITFASGSAVENFMNMGFACDWKRTRIASIGPVTSAALRRHGLAVTVEAPVHTLDGLISSIINIENLSQNKHP